MDNIHLRNDPCPRCRAMGKDRSGNNLGVFSDGHVYCWSCGYTKPSPDALRNALNGPTSAANNPTYLDPIPDDADTALGPEALFWLQSYGLINEDIYKHKILWSESRKWLIFPILDKNHNLLMWQARNFNKDGKSKWFTKGKPKEIIHLINREAIDKYGVIVVEDIISAIKVGHIATTMPIFGSHFDNHKFNNLKLLNVNTLTFWLDYDKTKESYSFALRGKILGFRTHVINTTLDPKSYTTESIRFKLDNLKNS